jgi:hypothetical protein
VGKRQVLPENPYTRRVRSPPLSRRQLIRTGLAGSVTAALAAWVGPGAAAAPLWPTDRASSAPGGSSGTPAHDVPRIPLHAVVLDERFAEAERFGAITHRAGLATRGLQGDVTDLWYRELYPLWKERAVPIAGLTAYAALFCLEQLAWDHRMRVLYRGAHTRRANDEVEHVVAVPQQLAHSIGLATQCDWPVEFASLIARVESQRGWTGLAPAPRGPERRWVTRDAARPPMGAPLRETALGRGASSTLYSWVIALPARA